MQAYPQKILIVEDEEILLRTLSDNFGKAGFSHILKARNGKEALDIALKESPQLILLDIIMPLMNGLTMLGKLRQDPRGKAPKVILLTNLVADEPIMAAIANDNAFDYVVKTESSIEEIISKAKKALHL